MAKRDDTIGGLRGERRRDEPMSRHTSWRVGGAARAFYLPADIDDLSMFLRGLPADEPLLWLGLGSNLLVRDGGFAGTVIHTRSLATEIEITGSDAVHAGAGATNAKIARFCARRGLSGAEFLAGIPGTLGGALAMNAGAFGSETWEIVGAVQTIDRRGTVRRRLPAEFDVSYRTVKGHVGEWFVAADLVLATGDPAASRARIRELLNRRGASQPINMPNAGSVFRNPPGDHAARLIETAGLKGLRIGGARVSTRHANFIVNEGNATASDIEQLIERVRRTVAEAHGVALQAEVHIVGDPA
jgi:UDP-N-acetylmuramate dehydrogenase